MITADARPRGTARATVRDGSNATGAIPRTERHAGAIRTRVPYNASSIRNFDQIAFRNEPIPT